MNANTTVLWRDLPAQAITTTTETALLVPTSTQNYGVLPSPTLPAGTGLYLGLPADLALNPTYDGSPFKVRLCGLITTAGSYTATVKLYQVPGTIAAAQTAATLANDNSVFALAATSSGGAGTQNFTVEAEFLWDSTTKALHGYMTAAQINGVNIAVNSGTAGTMVATTAISNLGLKDMNFIPSFTFGTAGANSIQITEFAIDRS